MDIYLATEQAYQLSPQFSLDVARDRVEQKKLSLVVGTVEALFETLFSKPKPEDIQLVTRESRLEPFWLVAASSRTVYDRAASYNVPVHGQDVQQVTVLGQPVALVSRERGASSFTLPAVEHCVQELATRQTFDGVSGARVDLLKHGAVDKTVILDLASFAPAETIVIPPQVRASAVARQAIADVVKPVQHAQAVHEERVTVEAMDLHFRPVYAFEYLWAARNKRVVVECDAITGEVRTGGKTWGDQFKELISSDLLFDVTADAAGMLLPGGSIAVRFVKAVVERGK
jgi:hypothetical protein